jgi:hypothetical protein
LAQKNLQKVLQSPTVLLLPLVEPPKLGQSLRHLSEEDNQMLMLPIL